MIARTINWPGQSQCLLPSCFTNTNIWLLVVPLSPCPPNPHCSPCLHFQTNGDFHSEVAGWSKEPAEVSPPGACMGTGRTSERIPFEREYKAESLLGGQEGKNHNTRALPFLFRNAGFMYLLSCTFRTGGFTTIHIEPKQAC